MRLVVDTNVVVSGLLWKGPPHALLEAARRYRDILLYASPRLLAELADVLGREKLAIAAAASGQPPERSRRRPISSFQATPICSTSRPIKASP